MRKFWQALKLITPVTPFILLKNSNLQGTEQDDTE